MFNPEFKDKPLMHSFCHRFDQALMSILVGNDQRYNFSSVQLLDTRDWAQRFAYVFRSGDCSLKCDEENKRVERYKRLPDVLTTAEESRLREFECSF